MKKNNELIHYKDENKLMITKKNYVTMILPIIFFLIIIVLIAYIVFFGNSSSIKLKNYLESSEYICNEDTCTKEKENKIYTYYLNDLKLTIDDMNYTVTIGSESPVLEIKKDETICNYTKADYKIFTHVDNSFIYDSKCEKYIENINIYIVEYKKVLTAANIDVNNFEK